VYPQRDRTEAALMDYAISTRTPLLGVCHGMQFIHAYFGGRLTTLAESSVKHVAAPHAIVVTDRRISATIQRERANVNSFHQYGVREGTLAKALREIAHAEDGTVEAFIHEELPIAGMMWHPERQNSSGDLDDLLLKLILTENNHRPL
jgi:putative glutamine amidotransferase